MAQQQGAAAGAARGAHGAAARERRPRRPVRERGGRALHRALADRGRDGRVQARPGPTSRRTWRGCARSCARSRWPPKARCRAGSRSRRSTAARSIPLEFDRFTRMQELTRFLAESLARRDHAAAGPAEEHRRDRARDPAAGAAQPRAAAGPHGRAPRAPGQPRGPLLPRRAPDREGARQEGEPGAQGHPRGARPLDAGEDHGALRAPAAQCGRARDRDRRRRASPRASPRSARSRSTPCSAATRSCSPSPTTAAGSTTRASASGHRSSGLLEAGDELPEAAARAVHLLAGILHGDGGHADRRPRRRHGRGEERDHLARRARRARLERRAAARRSRSRCRSRSP